MIGDLESLPHALYRFFAQDGALLYVGITADPGRRWREHSGDKPWWFEVASTTIERFPTRGEVLLAERAAVIAERPRYNVVYASDAYRIRQPLDLPRFDDLVMPEEVWNLLTERHRRLEMTNMVTFIIFGAIIIGSSAVYGSDWKGLEGSPLTVILPIAVYSLLAVLVVQALKLRMNLHLRSVSS